MSTTITKFSISFVVFLIFLLSAAGVSAQAVMEVNIRIDSANLQSVIVAGKFLRENTTKSQLNWTFLNSVAGAENLGERISDLNLTGKNGQSVSVKRLVAGEYLAEDAANDWSYKIDLKTPPNINATAHASWLANEQGILMLGDLLPQFVAGENQPISALIEFDAPDEWQIIGSEKKRAENIFEVTNIEKAIFLVGKNWREKEINIEGGKIDFVVSGEWRFSDDEAHKIAADILTRYKKSFGEIPNRKVFVSLVRFPKDVKFGRWRAETRGANLTILSSDMPFKAQSAQRLHEQLRHELLHLWMPNNLALTGNYDWFYEGFTVYQALRTGVEMNQIRFEDFLDTLSQAYNLDNAQTQKFSLLESSKIFGSGAGNSQVYARGMIVAFLCDVALRRQSKGRRSIENVFERIYRKHRVPNQPQDGNAAVLNVLSDYKELVPVIENYIKGAGKIYWKNDLESVGIEERVENSFARLEVRAKPNGRQKDLLDNLGYNNWRKMPEKSK
ncbi:MAG TPA: hypothetical protein VNI84_05840 [Pyrinomonadaceae bacterium]|nr:hypothetical protein [Pyrinomonadaceae bacterium]